MMSPNIHFPGFAGRAARPSGGLFRFWAQALQSLSANHFTPLDIPHRGIGVVKHSATRRSVILVGDAPLFQDHTKASAWLGATERPVGKGIVVRHRASLARPVMPARSSAARPLDRSSLTRS